MKDKYLSNSLFNWNLFNNDLLGGSKIWMNVVKSRSLLREGRRWIVGNGHSIRFWEDNRMGGKPLVFSKFKRLMELLKEDMGRKVEDYINQGRNWKKLYKDTYSQEDIQLLKELEELIRAQRPPILI